MRRLAVAAAVSLLAASCAAGSNRQTAVPDIPDSLPAVEGTGASDEDACRLGFGTGRGAEVVEIVAGVPAAALLRPGDVVVSADGSPITDSTQLIAAIQAHAIGDSIEVEVDRDGATIAGGLELVPHSDDPQRPMAGISIRTAVELGAATEAATATIEAATARVVDLEGRLLAVDPVAGAWQALAGAPPAEPWAAVGGAVYSLTDGDHTGLVAAGGGTVTAIDLGEWRPRWVVGSLGDAVLVLGEQGGGVEYAANLFAVDPASGEVAWQWGPGEQDDLALVPLLAIPDPSQRRVLVILGAMASLTADPESLALVVVDETGNPAPVELPRAGALPATAVAIGWHDPRRIAYLPSNRDRILTWDVTDGTVAEVEIPRLASAEEVLPVGDGEHFIMQAGGGVDLVSSQTVRPLTVGCVPDRISGLGFGE